MSTFGDTMPRRKATTTKPPPVSTGNKSTSSRLRAAGAPGARSTSRKQGSTAPSASVVSAARGRSASGAPRSKANRETTTASAPTASNRNNRENYGDFSSRTKETRDRDHASSCNMWLVAAFVRVLLICLVAPLVDDYPGTPLSYTDVDYHVFADAAELLYHGGSPYVEADVEIFYRNRASSRSRTGAVATSTSTSPAPAARGDGSRGGTSSTSNSISTATVTVRPFLREERTKYRYTPLIAFLLQPNVYLGLPSFGKLLFASVDLACGWLVYALTGK